MNKKKLNLWHQEEQYGITGWDFSHLDGRWQNELLPWNYRKLVLSYLKSDMQLLDMGTGGGELLKTFHHASNRTQVTEAWQPNNNLLKHAIAKQGIKVHALSAKYEDALPVKNDSLNMITNSHAAFNPKLIKDKLKTGGYFISQQVGALNNYSLSRFFDSDYVPAYPDNTLLKIVADFQNLGFEILLAKEAQPSMTFLILGPLFITLQLFLGSFPISVLITAYHSLLN
ncbi:SAM-dependent methyltransferase [Lactiplantibacillus plantarum]|uniref:SAM-dependent methyltransferase n=1 Tax=Lactiplantibacillus plantarum TaxID=1590 RepID=UPI0021CB1D94|nr:SAM-dependent methyltransferase [Lactiplantibacillus plantarum]